MDDGTTTLPVGEPTNHFVTQETLDATFMFNQRRFFVFLCFIVLASNIATSTIAERCNFMPLIYFVFLQHFLILPLSLCWAFARPLFPINGSQGGVGFLYNFGFYDRGGAIIIFYSGALTAVVASAVLGPRYGVFMPIDD